MNGYYPSFPSLKVSLPDDQNGSEKHPAVEPWGA